MTLTWLILVVCAPEEQAFRTNADMAICDWKADCYSADHAECLDDAEGSWEEVDPACEYDARMGRECLSGLEQLECPETLADEGKDFGFPSACDEVWFCP